MNHEGALEVMRDVFKATSTWPPGPTLREFVDWPIVTAGQGDNPSLAMHVAYHEVHYWDPTKHGETIWANRTKPESEHEIVTDPDELAKWQLAIITCKLLGYL